MIQLLILLLLLLLVILMVIILLILILLLIILLITITNTTNSNNTVNCNSTVNNTAKYTANTRMLQSDKVYDMMEVTDKSDKMWCASASRPKGSALNVLNCFYCSLHFMLSAVADRCCLVVFRFVCMRLLIVKIVISQIILVL